MSGKNLFHYVYLTTNLLKGKQYVGDRSCECEPEDDPYLGSGTYYKNAERYYGEENFKKVILEKFETRQEAFDAQEKYIKQFNTLRPNGYNISPTGGCMCGPGCHSEETKRKIGIKSAARRYNEEQRKHMSESHKGKKLSEEHIKNRTNAQKGLKRSEETKHKLSESHKGKTVSDETKNKLSQINKNKVLSEITKQKISNALKGNKNRLGTHHTKEQKEHIGNSNRGKKHSEETLQKMRKPKTEEAKQHMRGRKASIETKLKMKEIVKKRKKIICEFCGVKMNEAMYKRWDHGNNCKNKIKNGK